ncbi:MAG: hypothetical protein ACFFCI_02300 [Promethearchaeota archaeon]
MFEIDVKPMKLENKWLAVKSCLKKPIRECIGCQQEYEDDWEYCSVECAVKAVK